MSFSSLSSLTQRVITGVILLILFLAALFALPSWGWMLLALVLTLIAALEFGRLLAAEGWTKFSLPKAKRLYWLIPLQTIGAIAAVMWLAQRAPAEIQQVSLACAVFAVAVAFSLFALPHWILRHEWGKLTVTTLTRGMIGVIGAWLLMSTWVALALMREVSPWSVLMVMGLVWLADSAAYFTGRAFGKKKLAPKVSPGKTREGALGALVAVTIYAAVLAPFVIPKLSQLAALSPILSWTIWILIAWWLAVLSILGDLFESLVKRFADQKDSGTLLPGHGGLLDRVDSLLTTLPAAALAMSLLL